MTLIKLPYILSSVGNGYDKDSANFTYEEMMNQIMAIRALGPDDSMTIYCSGLGGEWDFALMYINAIRESEANIVVNVDSSACSAHAFIALSSPRLTIGAIGVDFLIHEIRGGWELNEAISSELREAKKRIKDFYSILKLTGIYDLLTKKELRDIKKGEDVIISGADMLDRFDKLSQLELSDEPKKTQEQDEKEYQQEEEEGEAGI